MGVWVTGCLDRGLGERVFRWGPDGKCLNGGLGYRVFRLGSGLQGV